MNNHPPRRATHNKKITAGKGYRRLGDDEHPMKGDEALHDFTKNWHTFSNDHPEETVWDWIHGGPYRNSEGQPLWLAVRRKITPGEEALWGFL